MRMQVGSAPPGGGFLVESESFSEVFTPEDCSDEHRMIAETAEKFVRRELLPRIDEIEAQNLDLTVSLLRKAAGLGLLAVDVPEEYGGLGLDRVSSLILSEKLACVGSFAVSYGAHAGIGTLPIVYYGTEEQKRRYLPHLASGELLAAYALTEAESGSDALAAKTRAHLSEDGTHWILNGEKMWISNAGFADLFIVFAKIDGTAFSAFLVHRDYPGVGTGPEEKKMGILGSSTRTLSLDNVPVPLDGLLGEHGKGHKIALNVLNIGRFKLGAGCVGTARAALADSMRYASERRQFGRPIAEFGAVREKLAEMEIRAWVTESMAYRTVGLIEKALADADSKDTARALATLEEYAVECSILKVWGTEMLDFVADEAVQIFGGNGYSREYPVERYYRDARINRIFEGTNEINRLLIVGLLLKKALKGRLPLMKATKQIFSELLAFPQEGPASGSLAAEAAVVANARRATLLASGLATQKFGDRLPEEQEVVLALAEMILGVYAMDSAVLRARKTSDRDPAAGKHQATMARCFVHEEVDKVAQAGRRIAAEVSEGDELRTYLAAIRRFTRREPVSTIRLRREVADRLLSTN